MEDESVQNIHLAIVHKDEALFTSLSSFVASAKKFNAKECSRDIVQEYLQFSGGCHEILDLIKTLPKISAKDVPVLLNTLTCILVRIANDINGYSKVGLAIVAEILNYGVKTIYNFIKGNQKSRTRAVLNLIASMIAQGPTAAHDVFYKLNMAGENFSYLVNKSNPEEEEDIRTSFLNVVILLLNVGDNNLIRQIVDVKGFLNGIFPGIIYDKAAIIILVLNTFSSKILNNPTITKTSRIRLFNDYTLKFVSKLYSWHGPVKPRLSLKRKLGDDEESHVLRATDDDIISVQETAHEFMVKLCCSYKYGIIFRDLSYGTSGWNQNHIITNLLQSFPNPYSNIRMSELVVSILKICPDQMKYYLPELKESFVPRLSSQWFQAMDLVKKVVQAQDCVSCLFMNEEKKPVSKLLVIAKVISMPEVISSSQLAEAFEKSHPYVCYHLLEYLSCILKQAKRVLDYCSASVDEIRYTSSELREFHDKFASYFVKEVPDVMSLESYWQRITSLSLSDFNVQAENLNDFEVPSSTSLLGQVLEILKLYRGLCYETFDTFEAVFSRLFTGLKKWKQQFPENDISELQLQLIDLFVPEKSLKNSYSNEAFGISLFPFALHSYLSSSSFRISSKIENIVYKLLKNSGVFDGAQWEAIVWMRELKLQKKRRHEQLVVFLYDVIQILHKKQLQFNGNGITEMQWIENESLERDGCMPEERIPKEGTTFSCLVPAALSYLNFAPNKVCAKYLQFVVNHIFHRQVKPHLLFLLISEHKVLFSPRQMSYYEFLCHLNKNNEEYRSMKAGHSSLSQDLQDAFVLFHSTAYSKESDSDLCFRPLRAKFKGVLYHDVSGLLWQLLTYVKFEADNLFINSAYITAIPSYVLFLQDLVAVCQTYENEVVLENSKICSEADETVTWIIDLLSHPAILKCFLPLGITINQCSDHMLLAIQSVSDFVFGIIKEIPPIGKTDVLEPLKIAAISFCQANLVPELKDDLTALFKLRVFGYTIEVFTSLFTTNDSIVLLDQLLSVGDELFKKLDPKGRIFSMLVQVYLSQPEGFLLPHELIKKIFAKSVQPGQKEKLARILKENTLKLLKQHPPYALDFPCDIDEIQEVLEALHTESVVRIPHATETKLLLQLFSTWYRCSSTSSGLSPDISFNILIKWIEFAVQIISFENQDTCISHLLDFSLYFIKDVDVALLDEIFCDSSRWYSFAQRVLKVALRDIGVGTQLINFLNTLIEKMHSASSKLTPDAKMEGAKKIYSLLSSHSNFCTVLLDDSEKYRTLKDSVVQLLITLVRMNSCICHSSHIPVFLSSYNATLNKTDQKLLYLLKFYEESNVDLSDFSPFLWGSAAVSHYSVLKKKQFSLWKQPKMQEILGLFQQDLLDYTSLNFPLNLVLEPVPDVQGSSVDVVWDKVYDPRFVLPLLSTVLSPGAYVNCRGFLESNVLAVIFGSLSSYDEKIRSMGYYCIAQFYNHLEGSMYGQRKIWIALLDSVRNSINGSNPRMPCIITLFLTKAVNILINPGSHMYIPIYKFLMAKPNLDLGQVPEFYKLFNSTDIEYRLQRSWILSLLEEGLRTSLDFHLCQKRYIFTILLPYYCCSVSNEQEKLKILQIILAVVKMYSSARTMCQGGLLGWLHSIIESSENEILKTINKILDTLWATCGPNNNEDANTPLIYSSFATEFELVHLSLLKKIKLGK